ncbi:hypothetical protein SAMN05421503_0222 [Terribacillus aidingensis]|uniref:Cyanobacterial TRADD-N associated 2 transmembrane domain-containing protein n=1 Tax=Terribacillus aidingensis TaxID=586416 RepID=A0A285N591_9BACI|nr:hypothetical protein [Terribacillus aidingensis]SNZ02891.1 hypothetical protein SAMN05421503_0222 [Terribacillus aidingensis]
MLKKNALYIIFLGLICILAGIGIMIWATDKFYLGIAFAALGLIYGLAGMLLYRKVKKKESKPQEQSEQ